MTVKVGINGMGRIGRMIVRSIIENKNKNIEINPNICDKENNVDSLIKEYGIPELEKLYYDVYDYELNKWNSRSASMEEKYEEDLLLFYQIFTGKKDKPEHIRSFGDIEMLDFHNLKRCINGDFKEDLLVSKNDVLFQKYMENINKIQSITRAYKKKLLYK